MCRRKRRLIPASASGKQPWRLNWRARPGAPRRGEIAASLVYRCSKAGLRLRQGRTSQPASSGRIVSIARWMRGPYHDTRVPSIKWMRAAGGGRDLELGELGDVARAERIRLVREQDHLGRRRDDLGKLHDRIATLLAIGEDVLASAQREQIVRVGVAAHAHPRLLPDRTEDARAARGAGRLRRGDGRLDRIHALGARAGGGAERRQLAQQRHAVAHAARIGHPDRDARGLQPFHVAAAVLLVVRDHQIGRQLEDPGQRGGLGAAHLGKPRHRLGGVHAPVAHPDQVARRGRATTAPRSGSAPATPRAAEAKPASPPELDREHAPRRAAPRRPAGPPPRPAARSAAARRARATSSSSPCAVTSISSRVALGRSISRQVQPSRFSSRIGRPSREAARPGRARRTARAPARAAPGRRSARSGAAARGTAAPGTSSRSPRARVAPARPSARSSRPPPPPGSTRFTSTASVATP